MTYLEKVKEIAPTRIYGLDDCDISELWCPQDFLKDNALENCKSQTQIDCWNCWNREIPAEVANGQT